MDVDDVAGDAVAWRRHLHTHPELSFHEHGSARLVHETLETFGGLEIERPTPTSVMARVRTGRPGPTLALRAGLDALPIQEETGLPFASRPERASTAIPCGGDSPRGVAIARIVRGSRHRTSRRGGLPGELSRRTARFMRTVLHRPGEGERHVAGTTEIVIKATGDDTGGSFFLAENVIGPRFAGPPPHYHDRLHDMFYVLEGTLTLRLGEESAAAGPGTFVCVPPGVVHTFSNPSDDPVRMLNFNTPSGWEAYMRELAEAARSGPLTPEVIAPIASRYDFHVVR